MAAGTVRYWAAARTAAGVAEEPVTATSLADALREARSRHGSDLSEVLDRSALLLDGEPVGGREPAGVMLADGWVLEVLPPFAGGGAPAAARLGEPMQPAAPDGGVRRPAALATAVAGPRRHAGPVARPAARRSGRPAVRHGAAAGWALAATGLLAGTGYLARPALAAAVFVAQALLTLAWFALIDAPGSLGGLVVAAGASVAADVLLATEPGAGVGRLAGVLGLALVVGLAHQLLRGGRRAVTSLAATVSSVMLCLALASLIGLRGGHDGRDAVVTAVLAAGAALVAGRGGDALITRPRVLPGGTRTWLGLVTGLVTGCAVGLGFASGGPLGVSRGLRLAAVAVAVAVVADLAVDLARTGMVRAHPRQLDAVVPVTVLLPVTVAAPAVYFAGRILLG